MKVISLAPDLNEILSELDLVSAIAGYSSGGKVRFPQIPIVSENENLNLDFIRDLKPDFILNSGEDRFSWTQICISAGFPVLHLQPKSILSVPEHLIHVGRLLGSEEAAVQKAKSWIAEFKALQYQGARDVNRVTGYIDMGELNVNSVPAWSLQLLDAAGISPVHPSKTGDFKSFHFDAAFFVSQNGHPSDKELMHLAEKRNQSAGGYKWHEESCFSIPAEHLSVCGPGLLEGLKTMLRIRSQIEARGPVINQLE